MSGKDPKDPFGLTNKGEVFAPFEGPSAAGLAARLADTDWPSGNCRHPSCETCEEGYTRLRSERDSLAAELAKAQAVSPDGDVYTAAHLQILLDDRDAFIVEQGLFSKYAERTIPAELRAACDGSYGAASTSEPQKKESET